MKISRMKFLIVTGLVSILSLCFIGKVQAESFWYSNYISSIAATDTTNGVPQINLANPKIQAISVFHVTNSTITYAIWKSTGPTYVKTLVATLFLPDSTGQYHLLGNGTPLNGSGITGSDLITVPYLYINRFNILGPTYCSSDTVHIIYKK
jgi:hypothetical protein